ncbi:hypothetical protein SAMN04487992_11128 [Cellulophaga baltica]|uniref:Uncharacterized protein n=1 Tax=Cellulophaga baltica TaxID=76594 RepID=A0A1G7K0Q3_9FLAO|nr:hypothetical protein SAMN04487992_11128 [Cellulophaga baltica]
MEYVFNYDYISEVLCINKDKPELNCNGKCYLMTKLAEESKANDANKKTPIENAFSLVYFSAYTADFNALSNTTEYVVLPMTYSETLYSFNFYNNLIKPPIA